MAGEVARQMAATPLQKDEAAKPEAKTEKNPIFALLGRPKIVAGPGTRYARTEGWGKDKKPHRDGGTNETIAFAVFTPFKGLELPLVATVYCERFTATVTEGGKTVVKNRRKLNVSIPFLKPEKRDGDGNKAAALAKAEIETMFRNWEKTTDPTERAKGTASSSDAGEDDPDAPTATE